MRKLEEENVEEQAREEDFAREDPSNRHRINNHKQRTWTRTKRAWALLNGMFADGASTSASQCSPLLSSGSVGHSRYQSHQVSQWK